MSEAAAVWGELLDRLEADLDQVEDASADPAALARLVQEGVGMTPADPPFALPSELAGRAQALLQRYGLVEVTLERSLRQLRMDLDAAASAPTAASVACFIDRSC